MSVKRYDSDAGYMVYASDYDELRERHNALVDAVHGLLGSLSNGEFKPTVATDGHVVRIAAQRVYEMNRADVDRLIADCKGEGE